MGLKVNREDDPRLIKLCTNCTRADCNGQKCKPYRDLEKSIYGNNEGPQAKQPNMEVQLLDVPRRSTGANGLRLYNLAIDTLEDLKEQTSGEKQCQVETMIKALRSWRTENYERRVNWYALEE